MLRSHDPRAMSFVDDIGISASKVSDEKMNEVEKIVRDVLLNFDKNQPLPVNPKKTQIKKFGHGAKILGTIQNTKNISISSETRGKIFKVKNDLRQVNSREERVLLLRRRRGLLQHKKQVDSA